MVLIGLLAVGWFFVKDKIEEEKSGKQEQVKTQENLKPTINSINSNNASDEPKIVFLRHNVYGSGEGGSIYKINYDGTEMEKINDDRVYNMIVSPLFNNVLYLALSEINYDFGTKKYLTIKLSEFPDFKNSKKISEYSLEDDLASGDISRFTAELIWSNNGRILSYFLRLKQNLSEGDVLFYVDNDEVNKEGSFVTNPFKDELSHYFDKIRRYRISPSGKFIAIALEEKGDRGLILYDLAKKENIVILTDIFSDDFFFDVKDNFYYSVVGKYKNDQKWVKLNAETELSDYFYNKPDFWDKFLNAVFSPRLDKMAYVCNNYYEKICIASFDGQNEKSFSFNDIKYKFSNISSIKDLFWSKNESHLFFTANSDIGNDELPGSSLWMVDLKTDNLEKIADLDTL